MQCTEFSCNSPTACGVFGYCRNKNTTNFMRFRADYPAALAQAMAEHPDEYMQDLSAEIVAAKMLKRIGDAGIGAVNIDSRSFKALAKKYGIKNTYKEWRPFLAA